MSSNHLGALTIWGLLLFDGLFLVGCLFISVTLIAFDELLGLLPQAGCYSDDI